MKKIDFQKVIEWLSFALRCPVCGYKYNLERTKIIDTKEDGSGQATLLVHSDCSQCKSAVVFGISINGGEIFSMQMITDLTSDDTQKFSTMAALNSNEVYDLHTYLKTFDGDFVSALTKN